MTDPVDRDHFVAPEWACPNCGNRVADWLIWDDNGETVTCDLCETVYIPGAAEA